MATVQNVVLSGLAMVQVPVVEPMARREVSAAAKQQRKEAKRAVMRERKRMYDAYLKEANQYLSGWTSTVNALTDTYLCQCNRACVNRAGTPFVGEPGAKAAIRDNPYQPGGEILSVTIQSREVNGVNVPYMPMPTHTFRRKVSGGETVEVFTKRLQSTLHLFWSYGFSFLEGACHCPHCRNVRKNAYMQLSRPANQPKAYADTRIRSWDEVSNPFAENYRYRQERTRTTRTDEDGNIIPRRQPRWPGHGIGGETFSDPKARGGASRLVGLEVEHNREINETHVWARNWSGAAIISDGSCGREAVTPPIAGENVRKCVTELCKALNDGNAGCDARCGLHVHVDARDMRWADMLRFLTVYCRVESFLFLIGGQNRYSKPSAGHSYCYPVAELYGKALRAPDPKGAILAAACLGDRASAEGRELMRNSPPGKKGNGRYKSINIMPWIAGRAYSRKDTTVEFRLHRGSHNAERVIAWAHLCQDIVDWCINATNADVDKLPKSSARALMVMSPRSKTWILRRLLGWRASTTAGKAPIEDDVGNYKPRRIVTMKGGLYLVDPNRCSYRRE